MLKLAKKAKVIGISATAKIQTVVGNYDITYLQNKLERNFEQLTDDEFSLLCDDFNKKNENYTQIDIHTKWFDGNSDHIKKFLTIKNIKSLYRR